MGRERRRAKRRRRLTESSRRPPRRCFPASPSVGQPGEYRYVLGGEYVGHLPGTLPDARYGAFGGRVTGGGLGQRQPLPLDGVRRKKTGAAPDPVPIPRQIVELALAERAMNAPGRNLATRVFDDARVMVRVADLVVRCSWHRKSPQFGYGLPSASSSGLQSTPGANEQNPVAKTTGSLYAHLSQYCQAYLTAFLADRLYWVERSSFPIGRFRKRR